MKQFVEFKYTILNKEYLPNECSILIDLKKAIITGWKSRERIWRDYPRGFIEEDKVFYIVQDGAEYGALVTDPSLYSYCSGSGDFQIFEKQFEDTFE